MKYKQLSKQRSLVFIAGSATTAAVPARYKCNHFALSKLLHKFRNIFFSFDYPSKQSCWGASSFQFEESMPPYPRNFSSWPYVASSHSSCCLWVRHLVNPSPTTVYMLPEFFPQLRKQGSWKKPLMEQIQLSVSRTPLNLQAWVVAQSWRVKGGQGGHQSPPGDTGVGKASAAA